jgi:hypothetical protein
MLQTRLGLFADELGGVCLGDSRLNRRLCQIARALATKPDVGLPRACRTGAAIEGAYRLLSNRRVTPETILEPHLAATCERARTATAVLAIHDTTEFAFGGDTRRHLGRTNSDKPGFFAHVSLGIRVDDGQPIGVLGCHTWARTAPASTKEERKKPAFTLRPDKESNRWGNAVDEIEAQFRGHARLVHVADREADQYRLMAKISEHGSGFIIRSSADRVLVDADESLHEAAAAAEVVFEREVHASQRRPRHKRASHGPRDERTARLAVSATSVVIKRNKAPENRGQPSSLPVNIVRVVELEPPPGEPPVEWILVTNLPVDTPAQIAFVVDGYRRRWTIEEFFKALKTGCAFEKAQLENERALRNLLAIVLPIAWNMLLLRSLARAKSDAPATAVLTQSQVDVLRHSPWTTLPKHATVADALHAVATLGGHIRNNGDPGWQTLYAGFRDLLLMEAGWAARSDQS